MTIDERNKIIKRAEKDYVDLEIDEEALAEIVCSAMREYNHHQKFKGIRK